MTTPTAFQATPVIATDDLTSVLYIIHNTFNVNGKVNTFQLNRIASSLLSNALFTALRTTNSRDGFETNFIKNIRAAYGIANGYNFKPEFEWNVDSEHDKFFSSKVPTEESVMKKILLRHANKYGVTEKVTIENTMDIMMEMEFADITPLDEKWNDTKYKNDLHNYMQENKDEVRGIIDTLKQECADNDTPYTFKTLLDHISNEVFTKPEPVVAFERLKADAENSVAISRRLATETWDKVMTVMANIDKSEGLSTLDGTDGLTGEDRYKLLHAILRNFEWSQKDCNDKLGEIALNPELENMEQLHTDNLNGALTIIPVCNKLIEQADEINKSNTSDEFSRMYEQGSSDNLSDDGQTRHDYEVEHNLPHGTVGH